MAYEVLFISIAANAKFKIGQLAATAGVDALVKQGRLDPTSYLRRHVSGDWGDVDEAERQQNDAALASGDSRLFSVYRIAPDLNLWIITEWDRSVTTMLLPGEY